MTWTGRRGFQALADDLLQHFRPRFVFRLDRHAKSGRFSQRHDAISAVLGGGKFRAAKSEAVNRDRTTHHHPVAAGPQAKGENRIRCRRENIQPQPVELRRVVLLPAREGLRVSFVRRRKNSRDGMFPAARRARDCGRRTRSTTGNPTSNRINVFTACAPAAPNRSHNRQSARTASVATSPA